jgi:hypothetical protein
VKQKLAAAWSFLRHAGYAVLVTLLYGFTLNGPFLFGLRGVGWKLVVTGLGGYCGAGMFGLILSRAERWSKRRRAILVYSMLAITAALSAVFYVGHRIYFDGTQVEYSAGARALYSAWIFVLSLLMRIFLKSVFAAGRFEQVPGTPELGAGRGESRG